MRRLALHCCLACGLFAGCAWASAAESPRTAVALQLPDAEITAAYEHAAAQNVLAAVNDKVFFGYWSVCADGVGFGYGNTYPSLDGHQMTDALLFLGQVAVVKANWDYVRKFQRPDGQLPLAIFPKMGGQLIGPSDHQSRLAPNGGLYRHWVPGDPLRALAGTTFIQNADVIFRFTQDRAWLAQQLPAVNLAADSLAALTTADGAVGGAGYYVERPVRVEWDGVAQCHAIDAFQRAAALNATLDNAAAQRYRDLAARVTAHFRRDFWKTDHFAEYIHPARGAIASHGLTDVDWSAVATGAASAAQTAVLWPRLRAEPLFDYGGMPTGIATHPETYEAWEFPTDDRMDLAAMGRVWYLECWARARMQDAPGLLASLHKVCEMGRKNGYYWRERYTAAGPHGAEKYCEYPANLIRIVQRFLFGLEFGLDGSVQLKPVAPDAFWQAGFGQTLNWCGRRITYRMQGNGISGEYRGPAPQRLVVRLHERVDRAKLQATIDNSPVETTTTADGAVVLQLPTATKHACRFEVKAVSR